MSIYSLQSVNTDQRDRERCNGVVSICHYGRKKKLIPRKHYIKTQLNLATFSKQKGVDNTLVTTVVKRTEKGQMGHANIKQLKQQP